MTEIIVTSSTRSRENMVFKIEDRGPVSSIKMSLNCKILTMMRSTLSVVSILYLFSTSIINQFLFLSYK